MKADVLIVGAGAAGLSCAQYLSNYTLEVLIVDEASSPGGQLPKQIHKFFGSKAHFSPQRGHKIVQQLLEGMNARMLLSTVAWSINGRKVYCTNSDGTFTVDAEAIVLCTGATERVFPFPGWCTPGVITAGACQTLLNVYRVLPGDKFLVIGAGNAGLVIAYQIMQAQAEVVAVVEIKEEVTGYKVHKEKITRWGVPVYTGCKVERVYGKERVEGACLLFTDGRRREIECNVVVLATGFCPQIELAAVAGCKLAYFPALGGWVVAHNLWQRTTKEAIFVAGDAAGVEEASICFEEGRLAAIGVLHSMGILKREAEREREKILSTLNTMRQTHPERAHAKEQMLSIF
jgi:thioredoxin reductase